MYSVFCFDARKCEQQKSTSALPPYAANKNMEKFQHEKSGCDQSWKVKAVLII